MDTYNTIRSALLSQTPDAQKLRQVFSQTTKAAKPYLAASTAISTALTVASLVCAISFPILGILGACFFAVTAFFSREFFILNQNAYELISDNSLTGMASKLHSVVSAKAFTDLLLKDTWAFKPFATDAVVKALEQDDKGAFNWAFS